MANVSLGPYRRPSMWRRMALAAWSHPSDPQVYARLEVDIGLARDYARRESEQTGQRITMLHLVARSVALALRRYPEANALVRCRRVYPRRQIDLFFQVAAPDGDLSGVVIRDVDAKSPAQIAQELHASARAVKRRSDPVLAKARRRLDKTPGPVYRVLLRVLDFVGYTLNLSLAWLGIPKDPFGGAMVTDLASLGIAEAFAPLVPRTRVPLVVAVGRVEDKPVVRDGLVVVRPVCVLCATFDHRVMDGRLAGRVARAVVGYLADPARCEGAGD